MSDNDDDEYVLRDGIHVSPKPVCHREEEYDSRTFDLLRAMQQKHFWYLGRHRFLLHALLRCQRKYLASIEACRAVDLGGGCGGWIEYVRRHAASFSPSFALADSSELALRHAGRLLGAATPLYQVDLMDLRWSNRWDVAFLLDVLEHVPDQKAVLRSIRKALAPGGLVLITVPALQIFWTWNDEEAHHQRRYKRGDFEQLAIETGLELLDARYFMFFLSPLLLASRWLTAPRQAADSAARANLAKRMHKIPFGPLNAGLAAVFRAETPLGHRIRFPWGTSLFCVLRKPA